MSTATRHRHARSRRSTSSDRSAERLADPPAGHSGGHRRRSGRRRAWRALASATVAVLAGLSAFLGAAVVTGRLGSGSEAPIATIAGEAVSSTTQTANDFRTVVDDRGPVRGTLRLVTPVSGPDARVTYVVEGPRTVVQVADAAPYELVLDTRTLPNGGYIVKQVVFVGQQSPRLITTRVQISNPDVGFPAAPVTGQPTSPGALASGGFSPAAATAVLPAAGPTAAAIREQVLALTNAERAKVGCPALTVDTRLAVAAQAHGEDMAAHNYFDHNSLDGETAFERITDAGYAYSAAAENIAAGQTTPALVLAGWMASPGHRANILNCSLAQIGIGYATGGSYGFYWVQDFGTPF